MSVDIQNSMPENRFKITRVGIIGLKKPLFVRRPDRVVTLTVTIDASVDLPSDRKGSHLSRNVEVISDIVDGSVRSPTESIEELAEKIGSKLLERHEYAMYAEVRITADYFLERKTPTGNKSLECYGLVAEAHCMRDAPARRGIGVVVEGMTACPSAMESVRAMLREKGVNISSVVSVPTHNQRNKTTLMVFGERIGIEANELIEIVENAMSSPTYGMLKRKDEAMVVYEAHERPMFVEDVVRAILRAILDNYPSLPDTTQIIVRSESFESIHKHNVFAERITTLGELRKAPETAFKGEKQPPS